MWMAPQIKEVIGTSDMETAWSNAILQWPEWNVKKYNCWSGTELKQLAFLEFTNMKRIEAHEKSRLA